MSDDYSMYLSNSYIPRHPECTIPVEYNIINSDTDEKVKLVTYKSDNFVTPYSHKYYGTIRAIQEIDLLKYSGQEVIFYFKDKYYGYINVYARGIIKSITYDTIIHESTFYRGTSTYVKSITFENGTTEGNTVSFDKEHYEFIKTKYGLVVKK